MKFSFKHFEFDCEQQILTQQGRVFSLNEKPAQLLSLFLLEADKIHSKDTILEKVWSGRVVTDQVVFQNISHLRALFGSDAIKTFTKKGYQWQLPVKQVDSIPEPIDNKESISEVQQVLNIPPSSSENKIIKQTTLSDRSKYGLAITLTLLICVLAFWYNDAAIYKTNPASPALSNIKVLPVSQPLYPDTVAQLTSLLMSNTDVTLIELNQLTNQALFDSPFKVWQAVNLSDEQLLLGYKFYSFEEEKNTRSALRFCIQGKYRRWQGYITATNLDALVEQLSLLLKTLESSLYFSLQSTNAALAQLTLLNNAQPDNQMITQQLIQLHYELNDFDVANALIDKQLKKTQDKLYLGLYHLLRINIANKNSDWQAAEPNVLNALEIFAELNQPQLESTTLIEASWFTFLNNQYDKSREYLNTAANKARIAREPLLEVKAHLTQSFMASKIKQTALMHSHMDIAKQLITLHQLNDEHQVSIHSNLAWSAHTKAEKVIHYQEILNSPFSALYKSTYYSAAEFIRNEFIKQGEYQQALQSIKPWQRSSFASLTQAQVAFAENEWEFITNSCKTSIYFSKHCS